jgi:predicted aspartyl protease
MTRQGLLCSALLTLAFILPANAQGQQCALNRFSTLPITTIPDGRFTVPAVVNGRQLDFLVDTGGVTATIDRGQAFNLRLATHQTPRILKGVAGDGLNSYAILDTVSLGRLQGTKLDAYIDNRLPPGVDGTLSPDMMKHYDVDIDLLRGTLSLFSQQHCAGKVVYWTKSDYVALPMEVERDGHIKVPVTVDGVKLTAFLDTGAQNSIISMSLAKKIGVTENSPDLKLVNGSTSQKNDVHSALMNALFKRYDYPFKLLDFNGVAVSNPRLQIVSDAYLPKGMDMLVGVSILRRLHLYVAYDEEKLYITPVGAN